MRPQHIHRFITLVYIFLFLLIWGCSENVLTFQVRFPALLGLKQNDLVYFDKNEIGQVSNVIYTKRGDYLVEIKITPGFNNAATENSRFYIDHSPAKQLNMAIIVEQEQPGGIILKKGAIVEGNVRNGYFAGILNDLQKKAGAAQNELNKTLKELNKFLDTNSISLDSQIAAELDNLSAQLNSFADELGKIPDSQKVKRLEESFAHFVTEFQKAQKDVQQYLLNEIIPQFRMALERLRKQLKKEGREKELEKIDKQVKDLYTV